VFIASYIIYNSYYPEVMETKRTSAAPRTRRQRGGTRGRSGRIPRGPPVNEMIYSSGMSIGDIASGTSGILSTVMAPTIANFADYASIAAVFSEVRLLNSHIIVTNLQATADRATVTSRRVYFGTNMLFNATTYSVPNSLNEVINLPGLRTMSTTQLSSKRIPMVVPANLEFLSISGDAPTIPLPFAGSPGAICAFAAGLTVSTTYIQVEMFATWHLRGRF